MSKEAEDWAKGIVPKPGNKQGQFSLKLDIYYLFLLVGLIAKKSAAIKENGTDILAYLPGEYKKQQKLIINFLLISRKKLLAIPDDAKQRIRTELLEKYIDADSNSLSSSGRELCNEYANGGFQVIQEKMPPPTDPSDFLEECVDTIKKFEDKF